MTREEAIAELNKAMDEISLGSYTYNGLERSVALEMAIKALEQEPKTGYWIVHEIESTLRWLECSNCHCETSYNVMHNYCPNCGTKMEVSDGNEI